MGRSGNVRILSHILKLSHSPHSPHSHILRFSHPQTPTALAQPDTRDTRLLSQPATSGTRPAGRPTARRSPTSSTRRRSSRRCSPTRWSRTRRSQSPRGSAKSPSRCSTRAASTFSIDFDGIQNRILALPVAAGDLSNLQVGDAGHIYYQGRDGRDISLHHFDLTKRKDETTIASLDGYVLSADAKKILYATRRTCTASTGRPCAGSTRRFCRTSARAATSTVSRRCTAA